MQTQQVYQQLQDVFQDVFDDDSIVVRPDLTASEIDEWDSVTHIRLMLTIEKEFGIQFSPSEIGRLKNVGELAALIGAKTAATTSGKIGANTNG